MPYKVEKWHALLYEQDFLKHHFLVTVTVPLIGCVNNNRKQSRMYFYKFLH